MKNVEQERPITIDIKKGLSEGYDYTILALRQLVEWGDLGGPEDEFPPKVLGRLRFVRYLVEIGRISDNLDTNGQKTD